MRVTGICEQCATTILATCAAPSTKIYQLLPAILVKHGVIARQEGHTNTPFYYGMDYLLALAHHIVLL